MLKTFDKNKADGIVQNILDACTDISKLSYLGYRWIISRQGFIAHVNREGFIYEYQTRRSLRQQIVMHQIANTICNRKPTEPDYDYYNQQCLIYGQIIATLYTYTGKQAVVKQTSDFFIEFDWCPSANLHKIILSTSKGSLDVITDKQFLLSLASNIHAHLQESEILQTMQP